MISKESRNHSSPEYNYSEYSRTESSPENSRRKREEERVLKSFSKGSLDEKISKRQTSSPKNTGKHDRHSIADFGAHSQEETYGYGKRDQTP